MLFSSHTCENPPGRVVVTGAGIVTALGCGWSENAVGLRSGRVGLRPITLFDAGRQRVQSAGEVILPENLPPSRLTVRQLQRWDRATRLLWLAASEAWGQSGWDARDPLPLVLGTTSAGMTQGETFYRQMLKGPTRGHHQHARILQYQAQCQAAALMGALGISAHLTIISNACASGANAIGHAWDLIRYGWADRALAGGYEGLCQMVFAGFDSLQALSPTRCRPFDAGRDGLALGEGAAVLALEGLESARRRGAQVLGEIVGYGAATDIHHLTQPHPAGDAALDAMRQACAIAHVSPAAIGYINAHGTGTLLNDASEAAAINRWAGADAADIPVSSTKSSVGHLLGAAGAVEAVVSLMVLREGWLPPTTTLETPDPACAFPLVRTPIDRRTEYVLSNSFGFGGANATLVLRRWA